MKYVSPPLFIKFHHQHIQRGASFCFWQRYYDQTTCTNRSHLADRIVHMTIKSFFAVLWLKLTHGMTVSWRWFPALLISWWACICVRLSALVPPIALMASPLLTCPAAGEFGSTWWIETIILVQFSELMWNPFFSNEITHQFSWMLSSWFEPLFSKDTKGHNSVRNK